MDVSASSTVQSLQTTAAPMLHVPPQCVALAAPAEGASPAAVATGNGAAVAATAAKSAAPNAPPGMQVLDPLAAASEVRLFERRSHLQFLVENVCVEGERLRSETAAAAAAAAAAKHSEASVASEANERAEQRSIALAESHGRRW